MKKFIRYKFFSKNHGLSKGIYKSLNCGLKSFDNKKNVKQNLNIAKRTFFSQNKNLIFQINIIQINALSLHPVTQILNVTPL